MSYKPSRNSLPAPCLVDTGTIINKKDMVRILQHVGRVRYIHFQEEQVLKQGEGYVVEVFNDPQQSTIVANSSLYLNVTSFDYMEMDQTDSNQPCFDLVQDNRRLRILPLSNPLTERSSCGLNDATLEAMLVETLTARWDACLDDESNHFPH
ncbi:hypothetical protein [Leptothoe sp. PORK10 BA2]|jgi:hypothetical protein|uniref:hypothetical protein n=1 Tax=Leptothoe sp. PORK10 BA2 TaxID=3110254 RepID=UPI002B1FF02D|nr:hypothetical protein [Leptothoe sp. PORK10 BA2]MEA5462109.1 hypothetical protein [Leptothoe sp. PORK10 BA2]